MSKRKLTRRDLFKFGAAAGAAAALPAIVPSSVFGAAAPSNRVTLAHIACGGRSGGLTGGFIRLADCRIVAACDPFKSRREGKANGVNRHYKANVCKPYNDFREMLDRDDIDAVVIATPDHWHVPAAIAAARAGKDMYVEKPLGLAMDWNIALRKAVHQYGRIFQYGTQQRSQGHMRLGCELVRNGYIGQIKAVEVRSPAGHGLGSTTPIPVPAGFDYDLWLGPAPQAPYTKDRCTNRGAYHISAYALGYIAGWGAHPLDIAVWGMGDCPQAVPVEYEGKGRFPTEGLFDTATSWDVRGRYANGVKFRFFGPGGDLTTFIGTEGTVALSRGGWRTNPPSLKTAKLRPGELHLYNSNNHAGTFIDCIKSRRQTISPIDVAVWSDTISHLSEIAIRTERKISWDPQKEVILGDDAACRTLTRAIREPYRL